jgi:hypothetical protein
MNPSDWIKAAIRCGELRGVGLLSPPERVVYLISEAEVYCDKDGIDSLIHRYGADFMRHFSNAFLEVGASETSSALIAIADAAQPIQEDILERANRLITERRGYTYESIEAFVIHSMRRMQ